MKSVAFILAPQQLLGLAEGVRRGIIPRESTLFLLFPVAYGRSSSPWAVMKGTVTELRGVIRPRRVFWVPTFMGIRRIQIATLLRIVGMVYGKLDIVVSGVPTYGLFERSELVKRSRTWIVIDDGIAGINLGKHLLNREQAMKGGRGYARLVALIAGKWPLKLACAIRFLTTIPIKDEEILLGDTPVEVVSHSYEVLRDAFERATVGGDAASRRVLVGTNLHGIEHQQATHVLSQIVESLEIAEFRPHRYESKSVIKRLMRSHPIDVFPSKLPIELLALQASGSETFIIMPGTSWFTIPPLLPGSSKAILLRVADLFDDSPSMIYSHRQVVSELRSIEVENSRVGNYVSLSLQGAIDELSC
jgi:hypothetical protein